MKALIEHIARALVDDPDSIEVRELVSGSDEITVELRVAPEDRGRVIGRAGRAASAMRLILAARGARDNQRVRLDIVD